MDITVKMKPEEYDIFRCFQRKKDFFEQKLKEKTDIFTKKHEELCSAVLSAVELETSNIYGGDKVVETTTVATIKDNDAAVKAHNLAEEWYA